MELGDHDSAHDTQSMDLLPELEHVFILLLLCVALKLLVFLGSVLLFVVSICPVPIVVSKVTLDWYLVVILYEIIRSVVLLPF